MNVAGVRDHKWSNSEKKIARQAFERAYQRECEAIQKHVRAMLAKLTNADDIWRVHDFLSKKRCEVDNKYDYRYSVLTFVFARLLKEGWLDESDLDGLQEDKVSAIKDIASL
ncbi:hypothetical protein [Moorella sp. Hama-1]|uniref:hypothetical protein n=1 Tax=Moorella sp. Hama-1 TaxID=2138101 RepID=UPI000D64470A|nr:hypothetical protein [Moorella sp. Hama-1]BCV22222.1 hypothetical protein hamaS1_22910 [Moorella sp. Hama-1]